MSRGTQGRVIAPVQWLWIACAASTSGHALAASDLVDGTIADRIFVSGFEYAPLLGTAFSPVSVTEGTPSSLTLTLDNSFAVAAATVTASLVDALPAGLVIASPANAATTCVSGTASATAGGNTLTLASGAQIPAGGSCTVSASVVSMSAATYTNTIPAGALQTDHGANEAPATASLTVTPASGCVPAQLFDDPGFETTDPGTLVNPAWAGTSTNFGVPFCSVNVCGNFGGTAVPLSGVFWALFGGANGLAEDSTIEQTVMIPSSAPRYLNFWLRRGAIGGIGANLVISVDGTTVATYPEPPSAEPFYVQRSVDVSSYADDGSHTLRFHFNTPAGPAANFSVDYVRLECSPGTSPAP
ncbi:hypothetical protein [Dokdonella sp.]|uniref:DUF7933 domain-containing protein n=1 Tax=Dokdonella sp. TaxID=2291710 RepID=UPI0037835209